MKPRVGGGEKLLLQFGAARDERRAPGLEHPSMDQVAQGFAKEGVAPIRLPEAVATENSQSGERVEVAGRFVVEGQRRRSQREDATGVAGFENVLERLGGGEMPVAAQVTLRQNFVAE